MLDKLLLYNSFDGITKLQGALVSFSYLIATLLPSMTMCRSGARSGSGSGSRGDGGDGTRGGLFAARLMSSASNSLRGGSGPSRCKAVLACLSEYPNFTANSILA